MSELAGFPYYELQVGKTGDVIEPATRDAAVKFFGAGGVTDLIVLSHGWNNDMADARDLYKRLISGLRDLVDKATPPLAGRTLGVLAVLWPSKKFAESTLIPGQAASLQSGPMIKALKQQIESLKGGFDNPHSDAKLSEAMQLCDKLEDSPAAQRQFADLIRSLVPQDLGHDEGSTKNYRSTDGSELLKRLSGPVILPSTPKHKGAAQSIGGAAIGGTAGGAATIGGFLSGIASGASNLLNLTTYYQMKERAGLLGSGTVHSVVASIAAGSKPPKIHLAGHSFGARLVTAIALGPEGAPALKLASMTLLQAAFSHNGFADGSGGYPLGFYRNVIASATRRFAGPVLITHSSHDLAVGLAYPLASRVAKQNAQGIGDASDPYGGLGRNGAQGTPEAVEQDIGQVGTSYGFAAGKIYNLGGDKLIAGHSDIVKPEIGFALLSALRAT